MTCAHANHANKHKHTHVWDNMVIISPLDPGTRTLKVSPIDSLVSICPHLFHNNAKKDTHTCNGRGRWLNFIHRGVYTYMVCSHYTSYSYLFHFTTHCDLIPLSLVPIHMCGWVRMVHGVFNHSLSTVV